MGRRKSPEASVVGVTEFSDPDIVGRINELEDLADAESNKRNRRQLGSYHKELAEIRQRAGLTQAEVARRLGTTQSAVARLESGTVTPTVDMLCRLANAFEVRFEVTPEAGLVVCPSKARSAL